MTETTFENAQYLNLGTFRKSGVRVDTPVWFATHNSGLYVLSNQEAGKIKRLKNSSRCAIAPCTFVGKATGPWQDSEAALVDNTDEINAAHAALKQKYGWQMLILDGGAWLGGRIKERSYIRIRQPQ
jgi:PPOX class probable F420-dependent enzyme